MTIRGFRCLLALSVLVNLASLVLGFWEAQFLSLSLRRFEARQNAALDGVDERALLTFVFVALAFIVLSLVAPFGLWRWKRWGRVALAWSVGANVPLFALMGAYVATPLATMSWYLASLSQGAILGAVYFSPLARNFESEE